MFRVTLARALPDYALRAAGVKNSRVWHAVRVSHTPHAIASCAIVCAFAFAFPSVAGWNQQTSSRAGVGATSPVGS
eukprot:7006945-Lingulodinium_polyedra.AAC.1